MANIVQWVPYEAQETNYVESESTGVGNLTAMALNYQACCPDSKMVLMGYSQVRDSTGESHIHHLGHIG